MSAKRSAVDSLARAIGVLYQRAAHDEREGDAIELAQAYDYLGQIVDEISSLKGKLEAKAEAFDAASAEHEALLNAVLKADETHALVAELAHTIRSEEWADLNEDGLLTPDDLTDKLVEIGLPISQEEAAHYAAWMTGLRGPIDAGSARILAYAIRQFVGVQHER